MRTDQSFERLLAELGGTTGTDLAPDANGVVTVLVDGVQISVESPDNSPFVYLHAPVRRLGPDRSQALEAAMASNLFALPLSGGWLALDRASDELVLCCAARLDRLNAALLAAMIDAAAHAVAELRASALAGHDRAGPIQDLDTGSHFIRV